MAMQTQDQTKEQALASLSEMIKRCPQIAENNPASKFAKSIDWHPRWHIIFKMIASVERDYNIISNNIDEIMTLIGSGQIHTKHCGGGGWFWDSREVELKNGTRIQVSESHNWDYSPTWGVEYLSPYKEQNTGLIYKLSPKQKYCLGQFLK